MLKHAFKNPALRKRAKQFGKLVRHSAMTPRTGETHKPVLVSNGQMGVTFIGHAGFFLQLGGENVVVARIEGRGPAADRPRAHYARALRSSAPGVVARDCAAYEATTGIGANRGCSGACV
jgi:hypothetical protein